MVNPFISTQASTPLSRVSLCLDMLLTCLGSDSCVPLCSTLSLLLCFSIVGLVALLCEHISPSTHVLAPHARLLSLSEGLPYPLGFCIGLPGCPLVGMFFYPAHVLTALVRVFEGYFPHHVQVLTPHTGPLPTWTSALPCLCNNLSTELFRKSRETVGKGRLLNIFLRTEVYQ